MPRLLEQGSLSIKLSDAIAGVLLCNRIKAPLRRLYHPPALCQSAVSHNSIPSPY